MSLLPNPSHLGMSNQTTLYLFFKFALPEFINPVALGKAREKQRGLLKALEKSGESEEGSALGDKVSVFTLYGCPLLDVRLGDVHSTSRRLEHYWPGRHDGVSRTQCVPFLSINEPEYGLFLSPFGSYVPYINLFEQVTSHIIPAEELSTSSSSTFCHLLVNLITKAVSFGIDSNK